MFVFLSAEICLFSCLKCIIVSYEDDYMEHNLQFIWYHHYEQILLRRTTVMIPLCDTELFTKEQSSIT